MKTKRGVRKAGVNKEFSLSFIFSVVSSILGFVFSICVAKFLQAEKYGELQYYLSISGLLSTFMIFGADNLIIKNIQFEQNKKAYMSKMMIFVQITSFLLLPFYFVIAYFNLQKLNGNIQLIFIIFALATTSAMTSLIYAYFTGISKNETRIVISGLLPHLILLLCLVIHVFTNTLDLFMKFFLYYHLAISLFIIFPFLLRYFIEGGLILTKRELITMTLFALTWITYNATTPIANIIIGNTYNDFGLVGIFSISNQLLTIAQLANGIIINISYPVFSKYAKENKKKALFKYYETVTRINIYISVPFYMAFAVEAVQLLSFFGESFGGHEIILILLSVSSLIEFGTGPTGSILLMGGKEKENLYCSIIKFVFYIGLTYALLKITIYAAPIALLVATMCANIAKLYYLWKFQHHFFSEKISSYLCLSSH